ncbi:MAG: outer membrane protein assembly factor BamB [Chromatiales bacterium]|nr:outer membrane protein assembly factor BamB [Chromatiales bacterium]
MIRRWGVFFGAIVLGGCSTIGGWFGEDDNAEPPTPLVDLVDPMSVTRLWSTSVGAGSEGKRVNLAPKLYGDRLYAADHEGKVVALNVADGSTAWDVDLDVEVVSGPAIAGGGLLVLGTANAGVIALESEDGSERWRGKATSLVLATAEGGGDMVVVRSVDGKLAGLEAGDGHRRWLFEQTVPVLSLRGVGTPVIYDDAVYVGFANGKFAALRTVDGSPLWESAITVPRGRSELARVVDVDADPVVRSDRIYAASYQGEVAALVRDTGIVLWRKEMSVVSGVEEFGGLVYVSDEFSDVQGLDADSGASLWKQDALHARALTGPVVDGDYLVVGDFEGWLHWLSREDGSIVARVQLDKSPIQTRPLVSGDIVYAYGSEGDLAAYRLERP